MELIEKKNLMDKYWISVQIPCQPSNRLADACNNAMEASPYEWVLLLDHDVYLSLLRPQWYDIVCAAIDKAPWVGWFTCWATKIGPEKQQIPKKYIPENIHDLAQWREAAYDVWNDYGTSITDITNGQRVSGFFILTSKTAWREAGGFRDPGKDGFLGVDNEYCSSLRACGRRIYRIDGLLVYHLHDRKEKWRERLPNKDANP